MSKLLSSILSQVTWFPAGAAGNFPDGELRVLRLGGRAYGIRRELDGSWFAIELSCRHQGADLAAGVRDGSIVTCPRHGWRYDLATGACLTDPTQGLRTLEVRVEDGRVRLRTAELGDGPA
jgi:nitrite reductase/ring-hydroxylating ferredoxin subunit